MSVITDVRDAVAAKLRQLLPGETINVNWAPDVERKSLMEREIFVNAEERKTKLIARGYKSTTVTIIVGVLGKRITSGDGAAVDDETLGDSGSTICDSIIDGMLGVRLGSTICTEADQPFLIHPELWRSYHQFTSFVRLTMVV